MDDAAATIADLLGNDDTMKQMAGILSSLGSPTVENKNNQGQESTGGLQGQSQNSGGPDLSGLFEMLGNMGGNNSSQGFQSSQGQNQNSGGPDLGALLGMLGTMGGGNSSQGFQGQNQNSGGPDLGALLGMLGSMGGGNNSSQSFQGPQGQNQNSGGPDLGALLGMIGSMGGNNNSSPGSQGSQGQGSGGGDGFAFDPKILGLIGRAMNAMKENDANVELLKALQPYLEGHRKEKVDEAIKVLRLLKLVPILQESGILSGLGLDFGQNQRE